MPNYYDHLFCCCRSRCHTCRPTSRRGVFDIGGVTLALHDAATADSDRATSIICSQFLPTALVVQVEHSVGYLCVCIGFSFSSFGHCLLFCPVR